MEVTVLGCWAPYPRGGGACSGYLIQSAETRILVDAGHGTFGRLSAIMDFRGLSAAVISHYHPDHCGDLSCVRHAIGGAIRDGSRGEPLPVYVPGEPAEEFARVRSYREALTVHRIEELPFNERGCREVCIGGCAVCFLPVRHNLPCYGMCLQADGKRIVYTADTSYFPELVEFARDADLLIAEASGYASDWEYLHRNHLTARQAGELGREAGVKRLMLTHFWPEYDTSRLRREAAEAYGGDVETAEGETYQV